MELVTSSAHKHLSLLLKQREAKQLETVQPFDKALKCGCFSNIKKFQGSLGKKWGHAKRVQKSDILTTRGFQWCRIGLTAYKKFQTVCTTHIMFYKERFIRNDFLTSQIFEKFKEQTSQFLKK